MSEEPNPVHAQKWLPSGPTNFVDRSREFRKLMDPGGGTGTFPVRAVYGMPGVGKTALAIRVAQELKDAYDELFYIHLQARADASAPISSAPIRPVETVDALEALLRADGVSPEVIAQKGPDELAVQWRRRLAEKTQDGGRILLILDDANATQIRPILPYSDTCLVLITSSSHLNEGLVNVSVNLEPLGPQDAKELFLQLVGERVSRRDAKAVADLMRMCGGLPLAVVVLAEVLNQHPKWSVATLKRQFADKEGLVKTQGVWGQVEAALRVWYDESKEETRRFLRRLALHPGVDIDRYTAAALDGAAADTATAVLLDGLHLSNLMTERAEGRYRMHNLIRGHILERAEDDEEKGGWSQARTEAMERLLDYYVYMADAAGRFFDRRERPPSGLPAPRCAPPMTKRGKAAEWLEAERTNLLHCAAYAYRERQYEYVVRIAESMAGFLLREGPWDQGIELHTKAVDAAHASSNMLGEARALINSAILHLRRAARKPDYDKVDELLGVALDLCQRARRTPSQDMYLSQLIEAQACLLRGHAKWLTDDDAAEGLIRRALFISQALEDRLCEAEASKQLSDLLRTAGGDEAEQLAQTAVRLCTEIRDELGTANALDSLGLIELVRGEAAQATERFQDCLTRYRRLGSRMGEANSLLHLARARRLTGRYGDSLDAARRGRAIYRELGVRQGQANALEVHGSVLRVTGQLAGAVRCSEEAERIYGDLGDSLGRAEALDGLGIALRLSGRYEEAIRRFEESANLFRAHHRVFGEAEALSHLGVVHRLTGQYDQAEELLAGALEVFQRVRHPLGEANALQQLGAVRRLTAVSDTDRLAAVGLLSSARATFRKIGNPLGEANSLGGLGLIKMDLGDLVGARTDLEEALERHRELGDGLGEAEVLNHLGELLLADGKQVPGLGRHRLAGDAAKRVNSPLEQARAHYGAARCLRRNEEKAEALRDMRIALRSFREIGAAQARDAEVELADLERQDPPDALGAVVPD